MLILSNTSQIKDIQHLKDSLSETWDGTWAHLETKLNELFPKYTFKVITSVKKGLFSNIYYNITLKANSYILCSLNYEDTLPYVIKPNLENNIASSFMDLFIETMNKAIVKGKPLIEALLDGIFEGWVN